MNLLIGDQRWMGIFHQLMRSILCGWKEPLIRKEMLGALRDMNSEKPDGFTIAFFQHC